VAERKEAELDIALAHAETLVKRLKHGKEMRVAELGAFRITGSPDV
jgi:hypothetical protein